MKTLLFHVNFFLVGGIEKVLLELLNGIDPLKYKVKLSIGYNLGKHEIFKDQIPSFVEVHYLLDTGLLTNGKGKKMTGKLPLHEKLFDELILPAVKKRLMRQRLKELVQDVDVVIDFDMTLAPMLKALDGVRKVAYCHFSFTHYWNGNKRKLDKLAHRLNNYDKVILLCDEMKDGVDKMYPFLATKTARIYNALNLEKVRKMALDAIPEEFDYARKPFLVSVGRLLESQKDFTTLIRGYALCVQKYGIEASLVIVGTGGDLPLLMRLAMENNVGDRVHFPGFQDNPYKWIARSSLFLFSSRFEGLPTVLIEALALQKTMVATECPSGVRELLMHGNAGILTPVGDVNSMAEGIQKLLGDVALQTKFIKNSAEILAQLDVHYMMLEFERLVIGKDH